ncbi:hypothetical protein ACLOJK_007431 [Asimina triloba]
MGRRTQKRQRKEKGRGKRQRMPRHSDWATLSARTAATLALVADIVPWLARALLDDARRLYVTCLRRIRGSAVWDTPTPIFRPPHHSSQTLTA